jgi:hypothetical protein
MPRLVEVLGESTISSLDKTAHLLRLDNQALEELAQQFVDSQDDVKVNGLNIKELEKLPEAIRTRALRICGVASGVHLNILRLLMHLLRTGMDKEKLIYQVSFKQLESMAH